MGEGSAINLERRAEIGQEKRARTRANILDAAFRVLGQENGRLARIEQITELARIARPTFYTYFRSMEELFAALSYELSHEFNSAVLAYCAQLSDYAEVAAAAIRYYLRKAAGDRMWGWGMVNVSLSGPIFGAETCAAATNTVAQGIKSGIFKVRDVKVGRDMVLGTAVAAMTTLLRGEAESDYPEVVAKHILIGLGVSVKRADRVATKLLPDPTTLLAQYRDGFRNARQGVQSSSIGREH
jgi:AcrR family transcriptional regulator